MTQPQEQSELDRVMFFSFGMFIIDEIEHLPRTPTRPSLTNLPGGAGLYALLGARLLSPSPTNSTQLTWILDTGSDMPPAIKTQIQNWQTSTRTRHDESRLTTRAWNGYGQPQPPSTTTNPPAVTVDSDHRAFHYLTPKRRLEVEDLTTRQLHSRSWHLVCSPTRCLEITRTLTRRRQAELNLQNTGVVVWEPIPDLCSPAELERLREAVAGVDVVSPNAEELRAFFVGVDAADQDDLVGRLMGWHVCGDGGIGIEFDTVCVVREGKAGSTVYFPPGKNEDRKRKFHVHAYHDAGMAECVVDPTGGGNTYLGALALALAWTAGGAGEMPSAIRAVREFVALLGSSGLDDRVEGLVVSAICAGIAAGFAIEQHGVPELSVGRDGKRELWGGGNVLERVEFYLDRERSNIEEQIRGLE